MNPTPHNHPQRLKDPRCRDDFQPEYYPKANGKDAPPLEATDRNDRITLEFLAAYYTLNGLYSRLLKARADADSSSRKNAETECLQAIERMLILRDQLEDEYAPLGVIAEPVLKEGFTVDVRISFGNVDAAGKPRSAFYTLTAFVPISLTEGVNWEDVPMRIEGPGIDPESPTDMPNPPPQCES